MLFWKKNIKQLSFPSSICLTLEALLTLIVFCIRPGESSVLTEMEKPGKKAYLDYFYKLRYIKTIEWFSMIELPRISQNDNYSLDMY